VRRQARATRQRLARPAPAFEVEEYKKEEQASHDKEDDEDVDLVDVDHK
jgi:hypothetical protein